MKKSRFAVNILIAGIIIAGVVLLSNTIFPGNPPSDSPELTESVEVDINQVPKEPPKSYVIEVGDSPGF